MISTITAAHIFAHIAVTVLAFVVALTANLSPYPPFKGWWMIGWLGWVNVLLAAAQVLP